MFKFKKLAAPLLATGLLFSAAGGSVSAAELESQSPTINWDDVWSDIDSSSNNISDTINFGPASTSSSSKTGISTLSWGSLATGSTALSSASSKVTSTGTTKGKVLLTVTSATTSLRLNGMGFITGSKGSAIGKFTATSEVSTSNPSGMQSWEGLTMHTATDSGVVYESATYDSGSF